MEIKESVKVSVRNLVEFVLMHGDIVSGFTGSSRNTDAIKAHQIIQKAYGEGFSKEVPLSFSVEAEDIILEIGGRIDGLYVGEDKVIIDEIKTTTLDLEFVEEDYNLLHWAQAKCYAYIYSMQNNLDHISVQLTYYNLDNKETKKFLKELKLEELRSFFSRLVQDYLHWAQVMVSWNEKRNEAIAKLSFPFEVYRKGQRELAVAVYKTIKEGNKLFAQAPTGIGKTMATLFPTIKALGEGHTSKIFYLTAKTITRTIAEKAINNLKDNGLKLKTLTLTAKEKICFKEKAECNPEKCEYAKGHFDRVKAALEDIFKEDSFTRELIEEYSREYTLCPFEFSLELSNWADCVICDYNYAFDPSASLKRFFMESGGDYAFLIDEAHNLVDRAREMFSSQLNKKQFLELKKATKLAAPKLSKILNKINTAFIELRKECEENEESRIIQKEAPKELYGVLSEFLASAEKELLEHKNAVYNEELLELYFNVYGFLKTAEYYDERYITYAQNIGNDVIIKLFCLDPSKLLSEGMKKGKAAVLFSATLSPIDYFRDILGGDEKSYRIRLASPFPRENLCLIVQDKISTKYKRREFTYDKIAEAVNTLARSKKGNYLIFFPSYQYMNEVYKRFIDLNTEVTVLVQTAGMSEEEREKFLDSFSVELNNTLVAFAVMGGIFGEGIDLTGDRLSGAIVVGVGLPQVCLERDIIRDYFSETKEMGFEYAYIYPGMNKVMQAVGRVIRTEEDRGVVMLIDERFSDNTYRRLFPPEWQVIKAANNIGETLQDFWNNKTR
ncbi:ATP-dependent DNA helicase [Clostridium sp. YIM B02515]|uniref:ATP-dependent DNA helicase n=1 Tax=Clostridium rhizosphaerae TaxID=2803861 RepID=A0ABS1TBL0_9CLOT|nr:ATP-dependent DNA helicase [Clostridium rhizosphaerae]MBL4936751.1 ATP-dependent DNA helicase [Clostridium rhizosphaerae]